MVRAAEQANPFGRKLGATGAAFPNAAHGDEPAQLALEPSPSALAADMKAEAMFSKSCTDKSTTAVERDAADLVGSALLGGRQRLSSVELLNLFRACFAPEFR